MKSKSWTFEIIRWGLKIDWKLFKEIADSPQINDMFLFLYLIYKNVVQRIQRKHAELYTYKSCE